MKLFIVNDVMAIEFATQTWGVVGVTVAKTIKKPAYDGFSGGKAKAWPWKQPSLRFNLIYASGGQQTKATAEQNEGLGRGKVQKRINYAH